MISSAETPATEFPVLDATVLTADQQLTSVPIERFVDVDEPQLAAAPTGGVPTPEELTEVEQSLSSLRGAEFRFVCGMRRVDRERDLAGVRRRRGCVVVPRARQRRSRRPRRTVRARGPDSDEGEPASGRHHRLLARTAA